VVVAILFAQSRLFEISLFPYAVVLHVTPIVSIAPVVLIWVGIDHLERALLILATIVAFFPILSNTTLGPQERRPQSAEPFRPLRRHPLAASQGAAIPQRSALPSRGNADFRRARANRSSRRRVRRRLRHRLNIPRMFAALLLMSLLGIVIFFSLSALEYVLLRKWHESAVGRET
jgi:NitT/TauT family transport system permease protein